MRNSEHCDPDTGTILYYVVPGSESENAPSDIQSESDSTASMITIESDELTNYFVLHHGRQQFATTNVAQWLPSDNIRLYMVQYLVRKWLLGGDYLGPVREILAPDPKTDRVKRVLELRTQTGTWTQMMANAFPHVQFLSLDLAPVMPHVPRANVAFEVYDFTQGLRLDDCSQDVVFLNYLVLMVKDYPSLLREVHRVLRPGGLIHSVDFNLQAWDSTNPSITGIHASPATYKFIQIAREHLVSAGVDPDRCTRVPEWLAKTPEVSGSRTGNRQGFKNVQQVEMMAPFYPHEGFPCSRGMDTKTISLFTLLTTMVLRDLRGVMKDQGMTDEEADRLSEEAFCEMKHPEKCASSKLYCTYAIKV